MGQAGQKERACVTKPGSGGPGKDRFQRDGLERWAHFVP